MSQTIPLHQLPQPNGVISLSHCTQDCVIVASSTPQVQALKEGAKAQLQLVEGSLADIQREAMVRRGVQGIFGKERAQKNQK